MTLICCISDSDDVYAISDALVTNSKNHLALGFGLISPYIFSKSDRRVPSGIDLKSKTFSWKRHFFMWSGSVFLFENLREKIKAERDRRNFKLIIEDYFNDSSVSKDLSVIQVFERLDKKIDINAWGCLPVTHSNNDSVAGFCGGSGAGDLLYSDIDNRSYTEATARNILIEIIVSCIVREKDDPEFYQKAYGFGLRAHKFSNGKMGPFSYKVDFLHYNEEKDAVGPIGGFRYFSRGRDEFFCKIDVTGLARNQIEAGFISMRSEGGSQRLFKYKELVELQYRERYSLSLAVLRKSDKISARTVDRKFIRYGLNPAKGIFEVSEDSMQNIQSMLDHLK